ncbi:hypothetical protein BTO07_13750 [Polaribacter sp. SA4-12]|nr:hypothetical protein BTO07_13750 [Polaribacter sp. SA4-12]
MIFSCASINQNSIKKDGAFEKLDSLKKTKRIINYSVKIDGKNWLSHNKITPEFGALYYYIKVAGDSVPSNYSTVSINIHSNRVNKGWQKPISIEDYLERFVKLKGKYKDFKNNIIDIKHTRYGKSYLVKFKDIRTYNYTNASFLFFYKNYGYAIEYSALDNYYDVFLSEVEKIVQSFKVEEK